MDMLFRGMPIEVPDFGGLDFIEDVLMDAECCDATRGRPVPLRLDTPDFFSRQPAPRGDRNARGSCIRLAFIGNFGGMLGPLV
jgi:hypothetical protein